MVHPGDVLTLPQATIPAGMVCPRCQATTFKTTWQTFADQTRHVRLSCAVCGRFVRYLRQAGLPEPKYEPSTERPGHPALRPPADGAEWLGLVRSDDGRWRAVALAGSLGACWDALLTTHMQGDRLCVPCLPRK